MPLPWYTLIPIVLLAVVLLFTGGIFALSRIKGGAYLQSGVRWLSRFGPMRRMFERMSDSALERTNPELASAIKKMRSMGGEKMTPQQAQKAMALLTPAERRAYMDAVGAEIPQQVQASNRQQRRRLEHGGQGMPVKTSGKSSKSKKRR